MESKDREKINRKEKYTYLRTEDKKKKRGIKEKIRKT